MRLLRAADLAGYRQHLVDLARSLDARRRGRYLRPRPDRGRRANSFSARSAIGSASPRAARGRTSAAAPTFTTISPRASPSRRAGCRKSSAKPSLAACAREAEEAG